jgi:hypothetical protein
MVFYRHFSKGQIRYSATIKRSPMRIIHDDRYQPCILDKLDRIQDYLNWSIYIVLNVSSYLGI